MKKHENQIRKINNLKETGRGRAETDPSPENKTREAFISLLANFTFSQAFIIIIIFNKTLEKIWQIEILSFELSHLVTGLRSI